MVPSWVVPLVPVKWTPKAYQDILDNFMLPTLWEQFWEGPFLFQHCCAPVHKARSLKTWMSKFGVVELDWAAQSPQADRTPIGWIRAETARQAFSSHISAWPHKCASGRMVQRCLNLVESLFQESWSCHSCKGWSNSILNPVHMRISSYACEGVPILLAILCIFLHRKHTISNCYLIKIVNEVVVGEIQDEPRHFHLVLWASCCYLMFTGHSFIYHLFCK